MNGIGIDTEEANRESGMDEVGNGMSFLFVSSLCISVIPLADIRD